MVIAVDDLVALVLVLLLIDWRSCVEVWIADQLLEQLHHDVREWFGLMNILAVV